MADLLIRDVPEDVVARLKEQAKENGRSLQKELLAIVEGATEMTIQEWLDATEERFEARRSWGLTGDTTQFIREDRDSR